MQFSSFWMSSLTRVRWGVWVSYFAVVHRYGHKRAQIFHILP